MDDPKEYVQSQDGREFLMRQIRKLESNPQEQEDILSEFTLKILEKPDGAFKARSKLTSWLFGVLNNHIKDRRRAMYNRNYARNAKVPEAVEAMGLEAKMAFDLIFNKNLQPKEAYEQLKNCLPDSCLSWHGFQNLIQGFTQDQPGIRSYQTINDMPLSATTANPEEQVIQSKTLEEVLENLTRDEKLALILKYNDNFTLEQCRNIFGCKMNPESCRKRVARILDKARNWMKKKGSAS